MHILTKTWYLEMLAPPTCERLPPPANVQVERLELPTVAEYLRLYDGVGENYHWVDRHRMADDELLKIIGDPAVEIDVLHVDEKMAGYVELDGRSTGQIELAYFGLFPEFVGRGRGQYFLAWAVARAWSLGPRRVWVHTCDLDHPAALRTYLRAGFAIYEEKIVKQATDLPPACCFQPHQSTGDSA